jgi:hypothetical protein
MIIEEKDSLCSENGTVCLLSIEDYDGNGIGKGYGSGEGDWIGEGDSSWYYDGNGKLDGTGFGWGYMNRAFETFSD